MMFPRVLSAVVAFTLLGVLPVSAEWLEFGAGCPEGSEPLTLHNITLDDIISFDVELQGLLADTVKYDEIKYLRFSNSPGTVPMSETGYPEIPVVTCFVAVPDDSDLGLTFSAGCMSQMECLPVYPAPLDSLVADSTCSPYVGEFFRKDSAAYASDEWYPGELAEITGEFMLRDQRVAVVNVHPVQYLPSEDSLRVWSDIGLAIDFTGADPDWNEDGLGYYDRLIGDRLLGYRPSYETIESHDARVFRHGNTLQEPPFVPDYVIITAYGLDGSWIDDYARYRRSLNGFDVLIARIDDILEDYGEGWPYPTPEIIRNYTEALWAWSSPGDRPTYLLLVGDHEDPPCTTYEPWFLPTRESELYGEANDEWYVCFDEPRETFSAFPDMIVGRLPAIDTDNLQDMLDLVKGYEAGVEAPYPPGLANRRRITRLSGTDEFDEFTPMFKDEWEPTVYWTDAFRRWMGYEWDNYYCGDGENTWEDGSTMTSEEWVIACIDVFERGSQMAFYADHGDFHMFSAGLNWTSPDPDMDNFGAPDSSFDDDDVLALIPDSDHWPPFLLLLCCSAGTFNHTEAEHDFINTYQGLCYDYDFTPPYDFQSDCLAEDFIKNTECGAIGVFAGSNSSAVWPYFDNHGTGILESVYYQGISRTGDAIQAARLKHLDDYWGGNSWADELAQFNLLGDPAVDIGDRMKFRDCCDLIISPADLEGNQFPTMSVDGNGEVVFAVTVRNAGWRDAGPFNVRLVVEDDSHNQVTLGATCDGLEADEETTLKFVWDSHIWFDPPGTLFLTASAADPGHLTPDSWMPNNSATASVDVLDLYPNDDGWPLRTAGSVRSPVALVDADSDGHLEIVVVEDPVFVSLYDPDLSDNPVWRIILAVNETGNDGFSVPIVADVCGDAAPEILLDTKAVNGQASLIVLDPSDGTILYEYFHPGLYNQLTRYPHSVAVGDIITQNSGNEIAFVYRTEGSHERYLQVLTIGQEGFELLDEQALPTGGVDCAAWSVISDMNEDVSAEVAVSYQYRRQHGGYLYHSSIWIYDWDDATGTSSFIESVEWHESSMHHGIPSVGELPTNGQQIALSRQYSNESLGLNPAVLLNPDSLGHSIPCDPSTVEDSEHILCCIMADWDPILTGADRILSNAEDQCFAWEDDGDPDEDYPIRYTGFEGTARPPFPALGELDDQDSYNYADYIVATREGVAFCFSSSGDLLHDLGFPYILPFSFCGGFAIADIDMDGKVEVVFGTMDNYLHVWELGTCDAGYAPWPQCQHDAARTGVLLEE